MKPKKRRIKKRKKLSVAEILEVYEALDDDDISTERLLCIVADTCGCDIDDVVEVLAME